MSDRKEVSIAVRDEVEATAPAADQKQKEERLAYMIAWRDRYIERLRERVEGREEEVTLLLSLLFYALCRGAGADATPAGELGEHTFSIEKKELAALRGARQYSVENSDSAYQATIRPRAGESSEGQAGSQNGDTASKK